MSRLCVYVWELRQACVWKRNFYIPISPADAHTPYDLGDGGLKNMNIKLHKKTGQIFSECLKSELVWISDSSVLSRFQTVRISDSSDFR